MPRRVQDVPEELERVRVPVTTVISWVAAILSITAWLGWAALQTRIIRLETGSAPMDEAARVRFEQADRAHSRIDAKFDRVDERMASVEQRIRALEAEIHRRVENDE